jgi:hypothetical protein
MQARGVNWSERVFMMPDHESPCQSLNRQLLLFDTLMHFHAITISFRLGKAGQATARKIYLKKLTSNK